MNPDTASRASSPLLTLYEGHPLAGKEVAVNGEAAIPHDVPDADTARLERNIERASNLIRGQHDFHNPAHGTATLMYLEGTIKSALNRRDTDPVLQAIFVGDRVKEMRGYLDELEKWSTFYSSLGPDEVEPTGADKCL